MVADWSPAQYLKFADERSRPARDLLAQVPLHEPRRVYDLGCGPGNSTALLVERYSRARVTGIDASPAMLDEARRAAPQADFVPGDLSSWRPDDGPDLLFANAVFQWIPDHLAVMAELLRGLMTGAVLAAQMPDNLGEPSHRLMAEVAARGPWSGKLSEAAEARHPLPSASEYHSRLKPLCARLDIWRTTYHHPLPGAAGIAEWMKGAGLKPYLAPLDEEERRAFLAIYESKLSTAYSPQADGAVLFAFPRLFLVAVR